MRIMDIDDLDPVRAFVVERLDELGINMREASLAMGRNHAYLQQFIKYDKPKKLSEQDRALLAQVLSCPAERLGAPLINQSVPPNVTPRLAQRYAVAERDLPVRGKPLDDPEGGTDLIMDSATEYIYRPPELDRVPNAFAMIMHGDSMKSAGLPHGTIAYIHPHRQPKQGDICVVWLENSHAYIRLFKRRGADHVIVSQTDPLKDHRYRLSDIQNIFVVKGLWWPG